jgi:putative Ca2+/H+ antiporter (TMEM165/GDT1 family)
MASFFEVVIVAFGYQLAVLPGEKVQFIIASLSTRYDPLMVVAAAGSAFAGWTALEILFGELLNRVLPGFVLDGITAGLFLLFALLLIRSAPAGDQAPREPDGSGVPGELDVSLFGIRITNRFGTFLPIFVMMAAGEFGDKTQLITIGLAAQYGAHPGIWLGEMLAIIPVSLANAYLFHHIVGRVDLRKAHFAGAALFLFFGLDTVLAMTTGFSVWELLVEAVAEAVIAVLASLG